MSFTNSADLPRGVSLLGDEEVLWSDHPYQGLFAFTKLDAFLVPFSILWGGFALAWNIGVWASDAPLLFRLFGLPFLVAGTYVTIGRFVHSKWIRSKTSYVLTTRRALIVRERSTTSVREVPLQPGLEFETESRRDGSGTVYFGRQPSLGNMMSNPAEAWKLWQGPAALGFTFYRVDDVAYVADAVRKYVYGSPTNWS